MRLTHINFCNEDNYIYASTNLGVILKLDAELNLIQSSDPIYSVGVCHMINTYKEYIYAREITGKLVRWNKSDLSFDRMIDLTYWTPPDIADVPNISHGLFFYDNAVYVSMPHGGLGKFSTADLGLIQLSKYTTKSLIECVSTDGPDIHYATDFTGTVYGGHIDKDMSPKLRVATGVCHRIIYDKIFNRYWATDDIHCGLAIFSYSNPSNIKRIFLSNDDVEWMSFNADQTEVLVACFDRYIYRFKNELEPVLVNKIGPLKYQVKEVVWASEKIAYAVTEAGEVYRFNPGTGEVTHSRLGTNAVWDIRQSFSKPNTVWSAFEDGYVREVKIHEAHLEVLKEKNLGYGMVRRILTNSKDELFVLTTSGQVMELDHNLNAKWIYSTKPLLRDIALRDDRLILVAETGEITCLNKNSGEIHWQRQIENPVWSVTIHPTEDKFMVGTRVCARNDQGTETTVTPTHLITGDLVSGEFLERMPFIGTIKRMSWKDNDHLLLNGNGDVLVTLLKWSERKIIQRWTKWMLNTCEAAVLTKNAMHVTTYGFQISTFDTQGEVLEVAFPFEDYATSLVELTDGRLLAGGRGAFLTLFGLKNGLPHLATTTRF